MPDCSQAVTRAPVSASSGRRSSPAEACRGRCCSEWLLQAPRGSAAQQRNRCCLRHKRRLAAPPCSSPPRAPLFACACRDVLQAGHGAPAVLAAAAKEQRGAVHEGRLVRRRVIDWADQIYGRHQVRAGAFTTSRTSATHHTHARTAHARSKFCRLDWDEGSADASRSMSFAQRTAYARLALRDRASFRFRRYSGSLSFLRIAASSAIRPASHLAGSFHLPRVRATRERRT